MSRNKIVFLSLLVYSYSADAKLTLAKKIGESCQFSSEVANCSVEGNQLRMLEDWQLISSQQGVSVHGKLSTENLELKVVNISSEKIEFNIVVNDFVSAKIQLDAGEEKVLNELDSIMVNSLSELTIEVVL